MVKAKNLEGIMFYNDSKGRWDTYNYRVKDVKEESCTLYILEDGVWKLEDEAYPIKIILDSINIEKDWIVTGYFYTWIPAYHKLKSLFI